MMVEELCWGEQARGFAAGHGFAEAEVGALEVGQELETFVPADSGCFYAPSFCR